MFRQGDILIIPVTYKIIGEKLPRENGRVILAHGESTGHSHSIESKRAHLYTDGEKILLRVNGETPVNLTHEEHSTISIPPGNYKVIRQREYTPERIRHVVD